MFLSTLTYFVAAFAMCAAANWTGLIPWRAAASAHWTERARLLWPARTTAASGVFLVPGILVLAQGVLLPEGAEGWIVDGIAAMVGAILAVYFFDREVYPALGFRKWWHQFLISLGFQFGVVAPFVAASLLMPATFGVGTLLVAAGYLIAHFVIQWGFLLRYLRWVKYLRPAEPRLQEVVDATAARLGIRVRATWQMSSSQANAFAMTATGELLFTDRLLEICNDDEIDAICAHELGHLSESKAALAGRLLTSLTAFPLIFILPFLYRFQMLGAVMLLAATLSILAFGRWLSQQLERHADTVASTDQVNEGIYAMALEKLYRENQIPAVNTSNNATHPHLYDRMQAAGITPGYPRPEKPWKFTFVGWFYVTSFALLAAHSIANVWF